jgi:two-component system, OmpR family, sensor histidine kinase KdpD
VAHVAALLPFRDDLAAGTIALLLMVPVLAATRAGLAASLAAALVSALVFNFFFTRPYQSFRIEQDESVAAFAVYLVVAAVVALVVNRARTAQLLAARRAAYASLLGSLSTQAMHGVRLEPTLRSALHELVRVLPLRGVAIRADLPTGTFVASAGDGDAASETAENLVRPQGPLPTVVSMRQPTGTVATPIAASDEVFGFLVADPGGVELDRDRQSVVESFAGIVALAAARARLDQESARRRALEETDRLRTSLVQSVSHDLRTPLTAIRSAAGALRQTEDPALRDELLTDIEQHADRLTRLVSDMLDHSRVEAGALRPQRIRMPVDELVWGAVEAAALPESTRIDVRVADDLPPVDVDETMLRQVVVNLLNNAAEHSDGSRAVEVEARALPAWIELRVIDHGPGIPEAERRRVFEPYLRLRPEGSRPAGSGLGLSIGRGFVEAHGGTIRIETTPGGGATVVVTLPREPQR